jgi:glycosyltransferase involved in cell wall biosynthesis
VPTYQGATYIEECLTSVASQTGVRLQVIVCDDRSSDGTLEIARKTAAAYPNVDWVLRENSRRLGMVENWNACVDLAQRPLIKIMGQDDVLFQNCLSKQAEILVAHPAVSLVAARRIIINSAGRKLLRAPAPFKKGLISGREAAVRCLLSGTNTVGDPVALLSRTSLIRSLGGFDCTFRYCTDVSMIMNLLCIGDFYFDPTPLVGYRVHAGAVGNSSQQIVVSEFTRCVTQLTQAMKIDLTEETRNFIAFKSTVLSLIRRHLYGLLNTWPLASRQN